jgi:hypothetical protein
MQTTRRAGKFVRRASGTPCPVCGHESWCTVSVDGLVARCMRVKSDRESKGGDGQIGWIHAVSTDAPIPVEVVKREVVKLTVAQVTARAKSAYEHKLAKDVRSKLAVSLGVSETALDALRVGYGCDNNGKEWSSWPCRDSKGQVIGISRRYEDGSKKTMQGTRGGLYYAIERNGLRGPVLIVEGGSDVAAAYTVGVPAIGRPSNTGGVSWIKAILGRRRCIVIGENDESPERRGKIESCKPECTGCGNCWPGRFGAEVVSEQLRCQFVMPPSGLKDFRDVVKSGCWWELIRACR